MHIYRRSLRSLLEKEKYNSVPNGQDQLKGFLSKYKAHTRFIVYQVSFGSVKAVAQKWDPGREAFKNFIKFFTTSAPQSPESFSVPFHQA